MNVQNRIFRVELTDKDIASLSNLSATDSVKDQSNISFTGKVIIKPWGYEFAAYEGQEAAIWILYIKKGHSTSLHCHPRKTTSLIILSGKSLFKITKYAKGTQHSGDHGNSDMERKPPTGTRQFGGNKASLAQAEIVEAVKYKIFREVCQAKLHWNIFFHFREIEI